MKISAACAVLIGFPLALVATAQEKPPVKEEIKAPALEDAKNTAKTSPKPATKPEKNEKEATAKVAPNGIAATPAPTSPTAPAAPKAPAELEAKLPQVDVNKSKITQLDHELNEQDRVIALEKKNTKATELDGALNSPALTPSILGGYSTKVRTDIAQERVELMEFEKELTALMARAKTKEEKAALKKQIDDIRLMRRTLDAPVEEKSRNGR